MKVIINADDFGYSTDVNDAVASLMAADRITSATLMADGERLAEAVRLAATFPRCSFGVHLALTEMSPISSANVFREAGLLDENGRFNDAIRSIRPSGRLKEAIFSEWSSQVQRVVEQGVQISHFDSHHHVHTIPWLLGTVKRLQTKFGVGRVRSSMNWYLRSECRPSTVHLLKKRLWNSALRHWPSTKTTDHFTSFSWFVKNMMEGEIRRSGVAELMVHPGQPYAVDETRLLWSDWLSQMPCPIELINYSEF